MYFGILFANNMDPDQTAPFVIWVFTICQRGYCNISEELYMFCSLMYVIIDFSLTVKAVTLIFISGRCSASSSAKQEKSGAIYNLVKK